MRAFNRQIERADHGKAIRPSSVWSAAVAVI
jgi:hypothetical protein